MKSNKEYIVYLVDDDVMFLKSVERKLTKTTGATVKGFLSGEECLKAMEEEEPSLIISDFYLNGNNSEAMNGDKLLRQIKRRMPQVSVIIMSAQSDIDLAISTVREGAEDYVVKNKKAVNNLSLISRKLIIQLKSLEYQKDNKKTVMAMISVFAAVAIPLLAVLFFASHLLPYMIVGLIVSSLTLAIAAFIRPTLFSNWRILNY